VYDFALLCAERFKIRFQEKDVRVNRVSQVLVNDTLTLIKVVSNYGVKEPYSITQYVDDFFEFRALPK
jgi:hypothetical protein